MTNKDKFLGGLVYCGSTAWEWIGRKPPAAKKAEASALEYPSPHVYGPAAYINVVGIYTHCSSAHCVLIDDQGIAYTFGRNEKGQLGDGSLKSRSNPYPVDINDETFVKAAVGRNHTILIATSGKVYAAGDNKLKQLGLTETKDHKTFTLVPFTDEIFVDVACGADFTIAITNEGELFSWGNPQYGQLGDGADHEYIGSNNRMIYEPQAPKKIIRLQDKKIVSIACGLNHSLALDDTGAIYTWGNGGYGRLGLNNSPPKDVMIPTEIPGFKDRNNSIKKIACGSTCSMAIDGRDALYLWGKWKNSGDGGQGTPWLYPKHFQGLSGWAIREIAAGGVCLFSLAEKSTISWGQSAQHGELGHGADRPRSATNAVKVNDLEDVMTALVACGLGQTLLLIDKNDPKFKELPVAGELVDSPPLEKAVKKREPIKRKPDQEAEQARPKRGKA